MQRLSKWCAACAMALVGVVSLGAQPARYSSSMEVIHGKPFVMVTVNGRGPFRFIIDTGTGGQAMVTGELAQQLGLPVAGETRLSDPTGRGGQTAPLVLIDSLRLAGLEFNAVKAVRHSLPRGDGDCQGMLGFTLFRDVLLTLDYPNARLILSRGALTPDGEKSVLPFRMPDGVPIASLRIGGRPVEAQMDSGGAGLSLPEQLAASLKYSDGPEIFGKGESLSTRFQIRAGKLASDVHLGDFTLDRPWVEINPAFPLSNFGACPMQHFTITFDQQNRLMRLESAHKRVNLGATPTPMRLANSPAPKPTDLALVPVG